VQCVVAFHGLWPLYGYYRAGSVLLCVVASHGLWALCRRCSAGSGRGLTDKFIFGTSKLYTSRKSCCNAFFTHKIVYSYLRVCNL
jgi:hypothetical protein